jgi:DNA-binding NarL/FixJ family response regulator
MRRRPFATALVVQSALLREGLARVLGAAGFRIIASGPHLQDITTDSQQQPILLVIDAGDCAETTVAEIELFKEQHPSGRVAVLTDRYRLSDMMAAFRAGANLYFAKFVNSDAFIKALELVMLGETILPPQLLALIADQNAEKTNFSSAGDQNAPRDVGSSSKIEDVPPLSAKEKCILRCMIEGDSNKVIARKTDIAEATVKVHVKAILRKIRVHNRTQAAIWAMNNCASIWPADLSRPSVVSLPVPAPLAQNGYVAANGHGELLQPPATINDNSRATAVGLADMSGVIRKTVEGKSAKTHDRAASA